MEPKRQDPRFTVEDVQGKMGLRAQVELLDLSFGGAAIKTRRKLKVGDEYALRFEVGGKFVTINAVVVWSVLRDTQKQSGETILECSAGLRFTSLLTGKLQALVCFIDQHRPPDERGSRFQIKTPGKAVLESLEIYRVRLISLSGMLIQSECGLDLEGVYNMEIVRPGEEPISFKGRVASCIEVVDRAPRRYEIDVGFLDMSPEDKSNLKTFIESIARG